MLRKLLIFLRGYALELMLLKRLHLKLVPGSFINYYVALLPLFPAVGFGWLMIKDSLQHLIGLRDF